MSMIRRIFGFVRELDEDMARMRDLGLPQHGLPQNPLPGNAFREPESEVLRSASGGLAIRIELHEADAMNDDGFLVRLKIESA